MRDGGVRDGTLYINLPNRAQRSINATNEAKGEQGELIDLDRLAAQA